VKLLLDEMISPATARQLRDRGHDVQAIKRDRPELESVSDTELVQRITVERRAIVTNDVDDFQPIHDRTVARGDEHYGMLFTYDTSMPRNRASIALWVQTLEEFLQQHPDDAALHNRIHHLT
jgi:predicted nuclease of predicted toxin-antitoxin system